MTTANRPGRPTEEPRASLSLLDYRRRVADLYASIRSAPPKVAHEMWREGRDRLFASHEQSAIPPDERGAFEGLPTFPFDPGLRFVLRVEAPTTPVPIALPHSGPGQTSGRAAGIITVPLPTGPTTLTIFRLDQYGDHLFLPFVDATAGDETYGGGRYLIDTAKGADLGGDAEHMVVDFNFAYHPSCVHDVVWSCPLAPPSNRLAVPIRAGERLRHG